MPMLVARPARKALLLLRVLALMQPQQVSSFLGFTSLFREFVLPGLETWG